MVEVIEVIEVGEVVEVVAVGWRDTFDGTRQRRCCAHERSGAALLSGYV